jgi:hypothetical protein
MRRTKKFDILFAIMAVQEVEFFAPMAKRLVEEEGVSVAFLTFHEAGDDMLEKEGIPYFSLHKTRRSLKRKQQCTREEIEKLTGRSMDHLIFHEMHMSGRDREKLTAKAVIYYSIFADILKENEIGCIVQELGGFIAPLTLYYAARGNNTDHVFIEPAMFKKRVVFTLNNLYADVTDYGKQNLPMNDELIKLVHEYLTQKTVVIPKKDRHFFQDMTFGRIFSSDNARRLYRKLFHKYVMRREEEYNWIYQYVKMHFIKAVRRKILNSYYTDPAASEKYVYYPFHVPLDVQLTARCPEFFDQESLVAQIAASLPQGYKLYIKEHPAAIGGHSLPKLKKALTLNRNIRLIHPAHNSYDIIRNAACIITVNSKVGVEAIMQGRPVVVLGKTFYRGKGVTVDVSDIDDMPDAVARAISSNADEDTRNCFLNNAFLWTYKGELYENSRENVNNFYRSLKSFLTESAVIPDNKHEIESPVP